VPFVVVRIAYAFLSIYSHDPKWNDLYGSVGIFVGMALVMEYIVVVTFLTLGFIVPPVRKPVNARTTGPLNGADDPKD